MELPATDDFSRAVRILYKNHRGKVALRTVIPQRIEFKETPWHGSAQWIMDAIDVTTNKERSFAMLDIMAIVSVE